MPSTPAPRPRALALVAGLALAALVLAGCGGGSDDDSSSKGGGAKTTTTSSKASTDEVGGDLLGEMKASLATAGYDDDQQACVVKATKQAMAASMDTAALDAAYRDQCSITAAQVTAAAYYAALLDRGVTDEAATCARKIFESLSADQIDAFTKDPTKGESIATGCGIDPKVLDEG
ncbi:MAG: hypothetical protein R2702_01270 [Acidimicrobiales bacterium]